MRTREFNRGVAFAVAAVAFAVALNSTLSGQSAVWVWPGKVQIRSTANDALALLGGISANGAISTTASFNGGPFATLSASAPLYQWVESDAATDNKSWRAIVDGTVWRLQAFNDAGSTINDAIAITRSGATVSSLALGTGGTAFQKVLSGTATWDPKNINGSGDFDSVLVTVTGVASGSTCFASFTATLSVPMVLQARYDTANTVRVILVNPDSSAYDPGSGTARVTCFVY